MPVKIAKNKQGGYRVSTPNGVKARNTTKTNAVKQQRLLNAIEHNPDFQRKQLRNRIIKAGA